MFRDETHLFRGQKVKGQGHESQNIAPVLGFCTLVSAGFFQLRYNLLTKPSGPATSKNVITWKQNAWRRRWWAETAVGECTSCRPAWRPVMERWRGRCTRMWRLVRCRGVSLGQLFVLTAATVNVMYDAYCVVVAVMSCGVLVLLPRADERNGMRTWRDVSGAAVRWVLVRLKPVQH